MTATPPLFEFIQLRFKLPELGLANRTMKAAIEHEIA
jgi:hypothetical protein